MDSVVHFELPADDLERAKKFYREVFDWDFKETEVPDYDLAFTIELNEEGLPKDVGAINGAITIRDETLVTPLLVIKVDSIDGALEKIGSAGRKVLLTKMEIKGQGYYARFADSEGNVIGLWENL